MAKADKRWLGTPDRFARLRRIENLDLETHYREITLLFFADFQSVMLALGFNGLMLSFAAPRMSRILSATGEMERRIAKRVVDTSLLGSMVLQHGFEPGPGRDAARRVNAMHSRYDIHQDDYVQIACDSVVTALDLAERFGWRPVTDKEREAVRRHFARQMRAFGGGGSMPGSVDLTRRYWSDYLDAQLWFEPQNLRMANVLLKWFTGLAPAPARPFLRTLLLADLDPRIVRACGLRAPSRPAKWASDQALKTIGRKDPVPDGAPDGLAALVRAVYPNGWKVHQLGTHLNAGGVEPEAIGKKSEA